jgi:hypothetical protein
MLSIHINGLPVNGKNVQICYGHKRFVKNRPHKSKHLKTFNFISTSLFDLKNGKKFLPLLQLSTLLMLFDLQFSSVQSKLALKIIFRLNLQQNQEQNQELGREMSKYLSNRSAAQVY